MAKDLRKKVLLYSGGMDSYMISKLERFDTLLYIDIGGSYSQAEISKLPEEVTVVKLDLSAYEREDKIVPLRNLLFCEIATNYGDRIFLGATAGDRVLDKTHQFAAMTSNLLSYLYQKQHWTEERNISIELPYKNMTKSQMIQKYLEGGGELTRVANESFSCYHPRALVGNACCFYCKPCFRKYVALKGAGFKFQPWTEERMLDYLQANESTFRDRKEEWAEIQDVLLDNIIKREMKVIKQEKDQCNGL